MLERITTAQVPEPPGNLFSNCLRAGNTLYISGQHAGAPGGGLLGDGTMADQTRQALMKIAVLVDAAGGTMADVVKLTIFATDLSQRPAISAVRREFFTAEPAPCSTMVQVSGFVDPALKIEIEAIAVLASRDR
ncbi:MAG TPA: RidA family protein [Xanthobacteraceae bacterium]|nr:RidA family protein [Xanthobacteraceae bacterium]